VAVDNRAQHKGVWGRLDAASFGIIYGSIVVLALLMAIGSHPDTPLTSAAVLFGSVLAVALAEAFAEVMSNAIAKGERITRQAMFVSWQHTSEVLIAANVPTLLFVASAMEFWSVETSIILSQLYCTALLMLVGGRVGWRLDRSLLSAILGSLFTGVVGAALAIMKFVIH
jgi:hypothetical protein